MSLFRRLLTGHLRIPVLAYSTKPRQFRRGRNPGVDLRRGMLKEGIADAVDDVDIEELESDFMDVAMSHKEHEAEMEAAKERLKYLIVREKYFKEKMPNFLTWSDKQQIKYLHRTDPEEWTIEKLSESFPALPDVIKKIIKSNWTMKDVEKIKRHDEGVNQNWLKFKNGELKNLPHDLRQHLKKFTDRDLSIGKYDAYLSAKNNKKVLYTGKPMKTEFSDIITSYEKLTNKNKPEDTDSSTEIKLLDNPNKTDTKYSRNHRQITLPELKKQIETAVQKGREVSDTEMLILKEVKTEDSRNEIVELQEDLSAIQHRYEKPSAITTSKPKKDYSFLEYPLKINIPKQVQKQGCLYKLNDCYYDDKGEFLYRVPGMCS